MTTDDNRVRAPLALLAGRAAQDALQALSGLVVVTGKIDQVLAFFLELLPEHDLIRDQIDPNVSGADQGRDHVEKGVVAGLKAFLQFPAERARKRLECETNHCRHDCGKQGVV